MKHLRALYRRADAVDRREGRLAYRRYHALMGEIASAYGVDLARVVGAFVALSPNSDYHGNLRSLISCLDGRRRGLPCERVTVSTYKHCRDRAWLYLDGLPFLSHAKGPKTRSFYMNVLDPDDTRFVTVDGHMVCAWDGIDRTMNEAKVSARLYREITADVKALAFEEFMRPCEMQATLWFARKRIKGVVYDPQIDLLYGADDQWQTSVKVDEILPYPESRRAASGSFRRAAPLPALFDFTDIHA